MRFWLTFRFSGPSAATGCYAAWLIATAALRDELFLRLIGLTLFECATLLIDPPLTNFLSICVHALVPELTILVVSFPRAGLLATIKGTSLQWLSILTPLFPVAIQFAVSVLANGLQPAALVVERPLPMPFTLLETPFSGKGAISEEFFVRAVERWLAGQLHDSCGSKSCAA